MPETPAEGPAETSLDTFPIRLSPVFRPFLLAWGVTPSRAWVRLLDARVEARFGFFRAASPLDNVTSWSISGPYRWWRAIGVRGSFGKPELTFGGSSHGGLALHFREPVRAAWLRVVDLYLTVDDLEGLGRALAARGIPGHDLRA